MNLTFHQTQGEAGDYLLSLDIVEARSLLHYLADQLLEQDPNETLSLPIRFFNIHTPSGQATVFVSRAASNP